MAGVGDETDKSGVFIVSESQGPIIRGRYCKTKVTWFHTSKIAQQANDGTAGPKVMGSNLTKAARVKGSRHESKETSTSQRKLAPIKGYWQESKEIGKSQRKLARVKRHWHESKETGKNHRNGAQVTRKSGICLYLTNLSNSPSRGFEVFLGMRQKDTKRLHCLKKSEPIFTGDLSQSTGETYPTHRFENLRFFGHETKR